MENNGFYYTTTNNDWERFNGPYDGKPWWGVTPPPTYDQLRNITTNATTTVGIGGDSICKNAEIDRLEKEIEILKNEINNLKSRIK